MRKSKNRYFYHIFVSPGDAPGAITLNVITIIIIIIIIIIKERFNVAFSNKTTRARYNVKQKNRSKWP